MTSVIIPEFIYDGIASAPAGQLLSGWFGAPRFCGGRIVQIEPVRAAPVDIEAGGAASFTIKASSGRTSQRNISSGGNTSASGAAGIELVVFQKCFADKE